MRPLINKILLFPVMIMVLLLLYFLGRILVTDQFIIPTWSMAPTLVSGDRVVVNKLIMGPMYIPRDGDIIQLTAKDGIIYKSLLEYETGKTVTIDSETINMLGL